MGRTMPAVSDVEPIRLLHVTEHGFLGGEQRHILTLLNGLDRARYSLSVCCTKSGQFVDEVRSLGVKHIPIAFRSKYDVGAIPRLAKIFRDYHIVHLHGSRPGLLGRIAAKVARVPVTIWTMHVFQADVLQGWRAFQRPIYLAVERVLAEFCDLIIVETETHRRKLMSWERIGPQKIVHIYASIEPRPRAFDTEKKREELGIAPGDYLVVSVGRLVAQKGYPYLLEAIPGVLERIPNVTFLLVGDGPMVAELQGLANRLGSSRQVRFLGYRQDAAEIVQASDLFVSATLWESFGLVFAEAMVAGKPVVATDVEPLREVMEGYEGVAFVPPRNPLALAQAMIGTLSHLDGYGRLAQVGRRLVEEKYSCDRMVAETSAIYERLIAKKLPALRR